MGYLGVRFTAEMPEHGSQAGYEETLSFRSRDLAVLNEGARRRERRACTGTGHLQHVHPCADHPLISHDIPARVLLAFCVELRRRRAAIIFIGVLRIIRRDWM